MWQIIAKVVYIFNINVYSVNSKLSGFLNWITSHGRIVSDHLSSLFYAYRKTNDGAGRTRRLAFVLDRFRSGLLEFT